ncbi:MAG: ABC transporter permease [Gemmatimonadales bacterium]
MSREPAWRRYLRFFRSDPESDIRDELDFHVELMADRLEAEGLSRDEALRRARREFGDRAAAEAACRDIAEDRERRGRWRRLADDAREDLRYGIRQLRRSPGFAALAILTLALGVGATTAIFSVVDGVLIRPLPFRESDRLVRLFEVAPTGEQSNPIAAANLADWRSRVRSFGTIGAHAWPYTLVLSGLEAPARVEVVRTEPEVFRVLGVAPILGRTLLEDDDASVMVVSGGLWKSRLGGDPGVVGRSLVIDGVARTVVGVMPPDFSFPASRVDVWFPLGPGEFDFTNRRSHNWGAVARLGPGVTLAAADAELRGIVRSLSTEHPAFLKDWSARVVPLKDDLVGPVRPVLVALLAGVALVLVIACANLANLFLARALTRGREIAVRTALGAERGRLIRQLMTELGVLATVAGVIGVALAAGLLRGLLALAPADLPRLGEVGLDPAALGFAVAVTVASTLAFGLAPAFASARADGALTLRTEAGRSSGTVRWRVRSAMLVAVALSLILLTRRVAPGPGRFLSAALMVSASSLGQPAAAHDGP